MPHSWPLVEPQALDNVPRQRIGGQHAHFCLELDFIIAKFRQILEAERVRRFPVHF
jgi:hypothetical protein